MGRSIVLVDISVYVFGWFLEDLRSDFVKMVFKFVRF